MIIVISYCFIYICRYIIYIYIIEKWHSIENCRFFVIFYIFLSLRRGTLYCHSNGNTSLSLTGFTV